MGIQNGDKYLTNCDKDDILGQYISMERIMAKRIDTKEGDKLIQRSMMVSRYTWYNSKAKAAQRGLTTSDVIRTLLEKWLKNEVSIDDRE